MVRKLYHFIMSECISEIIFNISLSFKTKTRKKKSELFIDVKIEICIFDKTIKPLDKDSGSIYSRTIIEVSKRIDSQHD